VQKNSCHGNTGKPIVVHMHTPHQPLAYRMRPKHVTDLIGQEHLFAKGSRLMRAIEAGQGHLFSFILWGPPGVGKTSLARALAQDVDYDYVSLNAVEAGVKDLRALVEKARQSQAGFFHKPMLLFIDEIHRFSKSQQDFLLPHVESGLLTLVGATTENPSFEVNSALLSRMKVFVLKELTEAHIDAIIRRAVALDEEMAQFAPMLRDSDLAFIARTSFGDARTALNLLEQLTLHIDDLPTEESERSAALASILRQDVIRYDKNGEEHYNIISALHKSLRDSDVDASIYWLMRMLEAGEDPKYVVRRMMRFASEDIGASDPQALILAMAVQQNVVFVGMPESTTALVELAVDLAKAPKDNRCYTAAKKAQRLIRETGPLGVPLHLRNATTNLMKELSYGKGYEYAHDLEEKKSQQEHFPKGLEGTRLWEESDLEKNSRTDLHR